MFFVIFGLSLSFCPANEVPAAAAEISGVSGGWEGLGGPASPQS